MMQVAKLSVYGLAIALVSCSIARTQKNEPSEVSLTSEGSSLEATMGRLDLTDAKDQRSLSAIKNAQQHIATQAKKYAFDSDHTFHVSDVIIDKDGKEHVRFDRKYKGLRVLGGDIIVHSDSSQKLLSIDKAFEHAIKINTKNLISGSAAISIAEKLFTGQKTEISQAELLIYARDDTSAKLAHEVVITGTIGKEDHGIFNKEAPTELHLIIDANTGEKINQWEGIQTVAGTGNGFFVGSVPLETLFSSGSYQLKDPLRGNQSTNDMNSKTIGSGTLFKDADNVWGTSLLSDRATVGVDAQFGAAMTWDYFLSKFGRKGIKNNGIGALSRVHYGRNYANAFWSDSCFCMTYGDGDGVTFNPLVSLDVAGHEMSHGVTAATAKLVYSGESGGLNEATSDIFGTLVEYYANNSKDLGDYLIGEKLYKSGNGKALRYMYQPNLDGRSPNCYSSNIGTLDVHYSSGVANHFFYLLAEGSSPSGGTTSPTCNSSVVTGIGRDAAGAIWYRALTVYMTSGTNYAGARAATLNAARDLFSDTSPQYQTVAAAWSAVGVN